MDEIQRIHQLEHIRNLYQLISGKRSLARVNFNRLTLGQKSLLLAASNIHRHTSTFYNTDSHFSHTWQMTFDELTENELDSLTIGLRQLQSIIDVFTHCNQHDFIKE